MNTYYSPMGINNSDEEYRRALYYQGLAKQERKEIRRISNMLGLAILAFEFIQLVFSIVLSRNSQLYNLYETSSVFQDCVTILFIEFAGLVIPFGLVALINRKRYKVSVIPNEKIGFAKSARWVAFGMLCCIAADYVVEGVIVLFNSFGYDLDYPETLAPTSAFACVMSIVATAVVPALCEEFAMRCCSLGLMRNYGKAFGVLTVSIIFGLLHGNVIQFVFAGLVGIVTGYVTLKTGSIWPAIFIHGCNNAMSVLSDVEHFVFNTNADSNTFIYIMFGFWLVTGIVAFFAILLKGEFKNSKPEKEELPYANTFGAKFGAFLSAPLLLLSFPFLLWATMVSIVPIE